MKIEELLKSQNSFFSSGETKSIAFRKAMLRRLKDSIIKEEELILDSLKKDLNKSSFEAYETEVGIILEEINYTLKYIDKWAKPKRVKTPLTQFPSVSRIYKEPFGTVLIMSPWNYPFQLTIAPLIGAIASGNTVIIKPSEYSSHTSNTIKTLIENTFNPEYIAVIEGGRDVNQTLLNQKFDYIFFTGSIGVGKLVMESASRNLTPVTLELGGKSPCIVDETANIALAAKRISWGKTINAGQTCVAPDYILVHKSKTKDLIQEMSKNIDKFYGNHAHYNDELPKIINDRHFDRLLQLMKSGRIVYGGNFNTETKQIQPTLLMDVSLNSPIMQEEIFGPILPIIEFSDLHEAIHIIKSMAKPLALYLFTHSKENERLILNNLSFGGGCINDTIVHLTNPNMPFGGVGDSGMGAYHGESSFNLLSHKKSILKKSVFFDLWLRYPPFKNNLKLLKIFMK